MPKARPATPSDPAAVPPNADPALEGSGLRVSVVRNAIVSRTQIRIDDNENLIYAFALNWGDGTGQGLTSFNPDLVTGLLVVTEAPDWEAVTGKPLRAQVDDDGNIEGLLHFLNDEIIYNHTP